MLLNTIQNALIYILQCSFLELQPTNQTPCKHNICIVLKSSSTGMWRVVLLFIWYVFQVPFGSLQTLSNDVLKNWKSSIIHIKRKQIINLSHKHFSRSQEPWPPINPPASFLPHCCNSDCVSEQECINHHITSKHVKLNTVFSIQPAVFFVFLYKAKHRGHRKINCFQYLQALFMKIATCIYLYIHSLFWTVLELVAHFSLNYLELRRAADAMYIGVIIQSVFLVSIPQWR